MESSLVALTKDSFCLNQMSDDHYSAMLVLIHTASSNSARIVALLANRLNSSATSRLYFMAQQPPH